MKLLVLLITFLFPFSTWAQDYSGLKALLEANLTVTDLPGGGFESAFNYEKAKKDPKTANALAMQSQVFAKADLKTLKSKNEAVAFWINAYNFYMIKIVLEKGFKNGSLEIDSVKDLGSFFSPYKIFTQEINNVSGKDMSLDQIEKKTLLGEAFKKKGWKDARIHFAVNCASVGCPPLVTQPYTANNLDKQLDENIKKAFKTKRHLHIKGEELFLTHLFKWYKKDFEEAAGSVKGFIRKYIEDPKLQGQIDKASKIEHIDYDWKLNRPQNFKQ